MPHYMLSAQKSVPTIYNSSTKQPFRTRCSFKIVNNSISTSFNEQENIHFACRVLGCKLHLAREMEEVKGEGMRFFSTAATVYRDSVKCSLNMKRCRRKRKQCEDGV